MCELAAFISPPLDFSGDGLPGWLPPQLTVKRAAGLDGSQPAALPGSRPIASHRQLGLNERL